MRYTIFWPNDNALSDSRMAAWNGRITDVTLGLRWALGKSFENAREHIYNQGGIVEVVPYSAGFSTLSDTLRGPPPTVHKPTDGVTVLRTGPDNSHGD